MYNTTVEDIYRLNPDTRESISIEQVLTIPQRRVISEVKEENYRYHTILPKETLYSVSRTYSLRPEDVITANPGRSEEHTSELQSRPHLVCRLLLEKKKKKK